MRLIRRRTIKVNLGNYESSDVSATVDWSHQDLGFSDDEWLRLIKEKGSEHCAAFLSDAVEKELDQQLTEEVQALNDLRKGTSAAKDSVWKSEPAYS